MLFGMLEHGMDGEVIGDKGKARAQSTQSATATSQNNHDAMWAVVLTKELWKKGVWFVLLRRFPNFEIHVIEQG